jgi:hypothetical protein
MYLKRYISDEQRAVATGKHPPVSALAKSSTIKASPELLRPRSKVIKAPDPRTALGARVRAPSAS